MSKNITINGNDYNGVSKIKALVQGTTEEYAEFIDASEISADNKVLITKTITVNGIYKATTDNADGYSEVTVSVPTGDGSGEVANFPFPHNNIQTGSFTPTENEETHSITLPFTPKGFMCIIDDLNDLPGTYAGAAWIYLAHDGGGAFSVIRYNKNNTSPLIIGNAAQQVIDGNTITLNGNVVQAGYYFYVGRTYNWVAWDY